MIQYKCRCRYTYRDRDDRDRGTDRDRGGERERERSKRLHIVTYTGMFIVAFFCFGRGEELEAIGSP